MSGPLVTIRTSRCCCPWRNSTPRLRLRRKPRFSTAGRWSATGQSITLIQLRKRCSYRSMKRARSIGHEWRRSPVRAQPIYKTSWGRSHIGILRAEHGRLPTGISAATYGRNLLPPRIRLASIRPIRGMSKRCRRCSRRTWSLAKLRRASAHRGFRGRTSAPSLQSYWTCRRST